MIRALKWLTRFLETRFPERVTISKSDLDALNRKLDAIEPIVERVVKLEMSVNAHSQMMGLSSAMGKLGTIGSLER